MDKPAKRRLGKMEQGIVFVNDWSALIIVAVLRLEGGPPPEVLAQALALLQARHPLLRAQIERDGGRLHVHVLPQPPPIPLQVVEREDDDQWLADTDAEVNRKLDTSAVPLMRVRYLYSPGQDASEIVFACHHAIMDAAAGISFCHELLSLCGKLCAGEPVEPLDPLPLLPPAESLYPPAFQGLGRMGRTAAFLLRQMSGEMGYRRRLGDARRPPVHAQVHTHLLPVQLSPEATQRLIGCARRERVTLNSAMAAAELLAVRKHLYQDREMEMRYVTFANLRPHLEPPVAAENLGAYFAMLQYDVQISDRRTLWDLARSVQQKLYRITKGGDKFITPLLTKMLFQTMARQTEFRMGATGSSYANVTGLQRHYGPIHLTGVHGLFPNNCLGPEYAIFARLLFGQLWLDVMYMEEDMDRRAAQVIADEMCSLLGSCSEGELF